MYSKPKVQRLGLENTRLTPASPDSLLSELPRGDCPIPECCARESKTKSILMNEGVRKVIFIFHTALQSGAL